MSKEKTFEDELISDLSASFSKKDSTASIDYVINSSSHVKNWIQTGYYPLDVVLSNNEHGGFPCGRLTEISGQEAAGKTLLASYIMANTQKNGGVAIYIDTEHTVTLDVLKATGVDVEKLIHIQVGTVEEVFKAMETIVDKITKKSAGKQITIVWDSVAGSSSEAEIEGDYGQATIAMKARLIGQGLRKYIPICSVYNVCLVFINQLRTNIGAIYGDKYITTGGKAIPFHASIQLRVVAVKSLKDNTTKDTIGRQIKIEVKKNKVAPPGRTVYYNINWGSKPGAWIDLPSSYWETGIMSGILKKVTTQSYEFTYPSTGETLKLTKASFKNMMDEPTFVEEFKKAIAKRYIITSESLSDDVNWEVEDYNEED